ncbi:MAG: dihydroneopterin aldolase [Bacteroidetes bacterium]|nr:MAG: dihydroneopterin aldolase [Bacteroidota bacterium]
MSTIAIEGMEFFAYHGCFKEERVIGTKFSIDLFLKVHTNEAEKSDKLEDTVNYQAVYQLVKEEMESKSNLLEHVGRRILESIREAFPQIDSAKIKIRKLNPPLGGKMDFVSLELDY